MYLQDKAIFQEPPIWKQFNTFNYFSCIFNSQPTGTLFLKPNKLVLCARREGIYSYKRPLNPFSLSLSSLSLSIQKQIGALYRGRRSSPIARALNPLSFKLARTSSLGNHIVAQYKIILPTSVPSRYRKPSCFLIPDPIEFCKSLVYE